MRVSVFVDGFNLYHAIKRLKQEHLKWLDLSLLSRRLVRPRSDVITAIYYFSAYAYWRPDSMKRHEAYVAALVTRGVTPVLGKFKAKQHPYRCCYGCQHYQPSHEEKESDVNLALYLLNEAYKDTYDKALVISRDSDQVPAIRLVRTLFPDKEALSGNTDDVAGDRCLGMKSQAYARDGSPGGISCLTLLSRSVLSHSRG